MSDELKITNLSTLSKNVEIIGQIMDIGETREVSTRYGASRVASATIEDETGNITLVVWGDTIDKIKEGDKVKIMKAYVSEWNGKLQLNIGKFGKLIVLN